MKRTFLAAALILGATLMAANAAEAAHRNTFIPSSIRPVAPTTATINYSAMYQYQLAQQQQYLQQMWQQQLWLQQQQLWQCQQQPQPFWQPYTYPGGY